jgi:prevent-host-death family protein
MKKASISILKAHLSQYLAAVKAGEEVIVTERGRPVARLTAVGPGGAPEGRAATLIREGRLRPPMGAADERPSSGPEDAPPADPTGRSLHALLDERTEGR